MGFVRIHSGRNHSCLKVYGYKNPEDRSGSEIIATAIETRVENIQTETVLKPLKDTGAIGINGGFFDSEKMLGPLPNYWKPPSSGSSICYTKGLDGQMAECEGIKRSKNFHENQFKDVPVSRKTMFIYDTHEHGGRISIAFRYAKHIDELKENWDVLYAVGGNDYNESSWGSNYNERDDRTVVAWTKPKVGVPTYVYLFQVDNITIPELKVFIKSTNLDLDPFNSVIMDCGGSSSIQYHNNKGKLVHTGIQNRYLYNIVSLIKE